MNYVGVRNPDGGTKVMVNYRSPVDNSAVTQAQMDKVLIGLKMKGDGNAMKGRNKELGTQASQLWLILSLLLFNDLCYIATSIVSKLNVD